MLSTPELVSRIRAANGDTQEGLARRLGVSFPTINSWERGRSEPRPHHRAELEELAASLGIAAEHVVLVIDDDPFTAELVRAAAMVVDDAVTVWSALDGWEGLVMCGALKPNLLLLDIMMPELDGLEVARRLPTIEGLGQLVIVFVTATQSPGALEQAATMGTAVIPKPLELDELIGVMGRVLLGESGE